MLFGNEKFRKEIIREALQFADDNDMHLVFGAVVGGISKGLQYADSDYDTRFLYVKKDFPNNIYIPKDCKEDDLKLRKYFEDKPYEWIPFWELSSFLQFLIEPCFDGIFSSGLYNVVGWTFLSPYTWDPYGIQNKIIPVIQTMFNSAYALEYHEIQCKTFLSKLKDKVIIKDYLYAIYAALSMEWIIKYRSFTPIYMRSMIATQENLKIAEEIQIMMEKSLKISNEYIYRGNSKKMHDSHYIGEISRNEVIDKYIYQILSEYEVVKFDLQNQLLDKINMENKIKNLYKIIEYSLKKEQKIIGVN